MKMEDEDEGGDEDDKPSFDPSDGNYVLGLEYLAQGLCCKDIYGNNKEKR